MVQSLILIDFLLSLTEKAKKRLASLETPNKSMLYSFTLNDDDSKWATTTRQAISTYLSTTLDGKLFNRMVDTVLARDKNWIRWKVESCPSIVRGPASTQSELEARTGTKHAARLRHVSDAPKGAVDLSFLVEDSVNGLKMLKSPLRYTETTVDALLDGIDVDELDLEMEVKGSADYTQIRSRMDSKRWRIIRQARADNLAILDKVEPDKSLKSVFRPQSEPGPEEILESEDTLQVGEEVEAVSIVIQNDEPMEANVDGQESMVANGAGEESLEEPKIVAAKEVQNMEELEAVEKAWTTQAQ
jgi:THO complex subunit 1